ncbi:MAG: hypothetical protein KF768_04195 [Phycisphaeraceae bacterium]|nr:hypothetical protein [Phycisphaeraceae bacterium]
MTNPHMTTRTMPDRRRTAFVVTALLIASALFGGCTTPPGVDVMNNTGRTLNVEYMVVTADGSSQTYSRGVVSRNANVTFKVDQTDTNGARIRFSLPEAPDEPGNYVQLNLPEGQTKYYDLEYAGGRIVARERKKGQIKWYRDE